MVTDVDIFPGDEAFGTYSHFERVLIPITASLGNKLKVLWIEIVESKSGQHLKDGSVFERHYFVHLPQRFRCVQIQKLDPSLKHECTAEFIALFDVVQSGLHVRKKHWAISRKDQRSTPLRIPKPPKENHVLCQSQRGHSLVLWC